MGGGAASAGPLPKPFGTGWRWWVAVPERLDNLRTKLRTSLWFVPSLWAVAAVAVAVAAVLLDRTLPAAAEAPWAWLFAGGTVGVGRLLAAIAGGMITVTGVAFSVTIVTLSLASSQFGPRLLRTFVRDRGNQWVLGIFVGTFLYCLVALAMLPQSVDDGGTVPRVVAAVALLLTFVSVGALIFFIHHVSVLIQADTIVGHVADELDGLIDRFYPGEVGDEAPESVALGQAQRPRWDEAVEVTVDEGGYVEAVDVAQLLEAAEREDIVVRVLHRPGEYAVAGTPMLLVWPRARAEQKACRALKRAVRVGPRRTEEQDVEFGVDQLVEVAVRALSPGINDPFTAMSVVDRLSSALCRVGARDLPSAERYKDGRLRVVVERTTYAGLLDKAFNQLRQHGTRSVAVLLRLLEAVRAVAACTPDPERRALLRRHADLVLADARREVRSVADLADLEGRYEAALEALSPGAQAAKGPRGGSRATSG